MLTAIMPSVVMAKVVRLNVMLPIYQLPLFKILLGMMVANYARYGAGH